MVIIELTYKKPLDQVDACLEVHRDFFRKILFKKSVFGLWAQKAT